MKDWALPSCPGSIWLVGAIDMPEMPDVIKAVARVLCEDNIIKSQWNVALQLKKALR